MSAGESTPSALAEPPDGSFATVVGDDRVAALEDPGMGQAGRRLREEGLQRSDWLLVDRPHEVCVLRQEPPRVVTIQSAYDLPQHGVHAVLVEAYGGRVAEDQTCRRAELDARHESADEETGSTGSTPCVRSGSPMRRQPYST